MVFHASSECYSEVCKVIHAHRMLLRRFAMPILRKIADQIAGLGYLVVAPDYMNKDPFVDQGNVPITDWLKNHLPISAVPSTRTIVDVLKQKGISSVGAVGFCWGGKVVVELAKLDILKVAVMCHPSFVSVDDIKEVKIPIAILAAETDNITPPAMAAQFQEILGSKKDVKSFVKIYPGTFHGWVNRYDPSNPVQLGKAEEAHKKIFEWLQTYLHE
ncbi:hypothetical protein KP509_23G079600 [Ceratopteris richardii]|uniref:Dienelactone hydrolase domain-containing protein n=2 Tax=Ceratopteris richardii TaxID=49495 RepID=A0A8T2S410_CERRI|nr:hypothetical protein KP509_23G079600 [Ceratopteris richardii]